MSSNPDAPRLWHVPCQANLRLVGETEMSWDQETLLIPAHTAEEASELARKRGFTVNDEPTPWEEVSIGQTPFRIILQQVGE